MSSDRTDDKGTMVRSATGNHTAPIPELYQVYRLLARAAAHKFRCQAHHQASRYTPATENQQTHTLYYTIM